MKKFLVLAMAATLLMAGSAFAVQRNVSTNALTPFPELTFTNGVQPTSTNNNDTCDIGVTPAATLLLPYFEVDTAAAAGAGATTLWTITNTSRYPQIAHVTVWTDWSFPVLDFNIFLTGYDVQGINMFDLIVRGIIVPGTPSGTSITTVPGTAPATVTGATPFSNTSNPNFVTSGGANVSSTCSGLPGTLDPGLVAAVRSALTIGTGYNTGGVSCSGPVGANHGAIAKGYVTVDVASYCSTQLPTDPGGAYFVGSTASILFDNTLIGDYQQIAPAPTGFGTAGTFDAQGNPMVHIRAVPEGGLSGASGGIPVATNLPFTFYDRYTPTGLRTADRRQPLPNTWAARYIQGGTGTFATDYKIWREGVTSGLPSCTASGTVQLNSVIAITSLITFDEHENATALGGGQVCSPCAPSNVSLPETSRTASTAGVFAQPATADLGGWRYMNLSSNSSHVTTAGLVQDLTLSAQRVGFGGPNAPGTSGSRTTTQNWVIVSMYGVIGANRLSVDFDAAWMGNGCTNATGAGAVIAPESQRGGPLVCPTNTPSTNCGAGTLPPYVNP
jgi:hypothetical protein